jgi:hypothetical protein
VAPPRKRKRLTKIAKASVEKAKHAGRFVYASRKKIIDALEAVAAVAGIVSEVFGKPGRSRRRKR